jgi:uncharacterized coiled-coil protein SlyX
MTQTTEERIREILTSVSVQEESIAGAYHEIQQTLQRSLVEELTKQLDIAKEKVLSMRANVVDPQSDKDFEDVDYNTGLADAVDIFTRSINEWKQRMEDK